MPSVVQCLLTEADVAVAVSSPKAAERCLALLRQLLSDLQNLQEKDSAAGNALLEAALSIANGDARKQSTHSLASLSLSLAQAAKFSPTLSLRGIAAALSSSEVEHDTAPSHLCQLMHATAVICVCKYTAQLIDANA